MKRETLLDFFNDLSGHAAQFLVYDDGFRSWTYSYKEIALAVKNFQEFLFQHKILKGQKVVIWGESHPEWIVAFWGCICSGVIVVPVDYRASEDYVSRIAASVRASALVHGDEVNVPPKQSILIVPLNGLLAVDSSSPQIEPDVLREDIAEIIFTAGATADPKGVLISHANILANIVPIEREIAKYRSWARIFYPIRFLNLLPLSHMFGQAMATFVPPMLPGVVVFLKTQSSNEVIRQIKMRRISVLICVPKMLELLRAYVSSRFPEAVTPEAQSIGVVRRWWRYRRVHRMFGWKFWAFVVGAAPLDPDLEAYWLRLGFAVVQGYGLTETAPIVTLNHPFHTKRGSVGKPIGGVQVKIAEDGEILVRGGNVTTEYYNADETAFEDGWFHTGDVGEMDESGNLYIKGRKKEMIVTPEGLNVFPEDVERVLNAIPGVQDSAVVGIREDGRERVHAVLVVEGISPDEAIRQANSRLEAHQRIRSASIWSDGDLPRTEGTRKLKRTEIRGAVSGKPRTHPKESHRAASIEDLINRYASGRALTQSTTLDELGLSSLDRVELMTALESQLNTSFGEADFSGVTTIQDLHRLVEPVASWAPSEPFDFPRWNRSAPARWLRRISLPAIVLPLTRAFAWISIEGKENLKTLKGPVIFAANHQSHMDTPAILAALPKRWRYRTAVAMSKEFFHAHFFPKQHSRFEWMTNTANYTLAALFFNAFPLPQRETGAKHTMRYVGELTGEGWSILIYPEGKRTERGEISTFQAGVGLLASRLQCPVVPVHIDGLDRVLHKSWRMAKPGRVRVRFGAPLSFSGDDYRHFAGEMEKAVRSL